MSLELGSTGNLPVPGPESFRAPKGGLIRTHQKVGSLPSLPSGKLPDGTGKLPVLPGFLLHRSGVFSANQGQNRMSNQVSGGEMLLK